MGNRANSIHLLSAKLSHRDECFPKQGKPDFLPSSYHLLV